MEERERCYSFVLSRRGRCILFLLRNFIRMELRFGIFADNKSLGGRSRLPCKEQLFLYSFLFHQVFLSQILTVGWSSVLRSRPRNQKSWVQIPVVGRSFCDEQLGTYTCSRVMAVYINITYINVQFMYVSVI
jgi:hypothetical protein